ncbi:MAG: tRNA pseudouridine(38-40) synthase TruA [Eubacteriales bacterium]|nr:tRNA pseudouridine(38-40) synthase TruA [Eubacteriales bacterium]
MAVAADEERTTDIRRFALLTEYDGSQFFGWQKQAHHRTVEHELQKVLTRLVQDPGIVVYGCSRTDTGVHAKGHVSHFSAQTSIPVNRLPMALNSLLPADICVRDAAIVSPGFHARYDVIGKRYRYQIWNHPIRPAISRREMAHVPGPFSVQRVIEALPLLVGRKDFRAFCDTGGSYHSTIRTIQRIRLTSSGSLLRIDVQGDGFLYHMVRIIAGTLVAVGQRKIEPAAVESIIQTGDRRLAGKTMPAQGLCLEDVFYKQPLFEDHTKPIESECDIDVQYAME